MRRLLPVLALAAAATVAQIPAASPAQAHSTTYCGHGVHWHLGSRAEFVSSRNVLFQDGQVAHFHTVAVHTWSGGLVFYSVRC